jgi:hypothetical protein
METLNEKYSNIKSLDEALEIISEQDRLVGQLSREVRYLKDSVSRRTDWLSHAKREAGYEQSESFDVVWKEVLDKSRNNNPSPGFEFTEWLGKNYVRLNRVWVHRDSDPTEYDNWKTTQELYDGWIGNGN